MFCSKQVIGKTRANDPSKLRSLWIQCLPYILQSVTLWLCMITHINLCGISKYAPAAVDPGMALLSLGTLQYPVTIVLEIEIKYFLNCRSQNWHVCNFTPSLLIAHLVNYPRNNSFSSINSLVKYLKTVFNNVILWGRLALNFWPFWLI